MKNQEPKTILLVEDDAATMLVEAHLLKGFGYAVVAAKSGEEAVQIAGSNDKIALVLMDIELGAGMDGAEAAIQILAKRHLPIVFISSHAEKEYVERIKGIAGYGYVIKNSGDVVLQSSIEMAFNLFESQETLHQSEAELRRITDNINDVVFITDLNFKYTYISPSVEKLTGDTVDVHMKKSIEEIHPPKSLMKMRSILMEELEKEKSPNIDKDRTRVIELERYKADGSIIDISVHISFVRDNNGKPIGIQGVTRDITERKRSEEALRESERSLAMTFSSIGDAVIATDARCCVVRMNRVAEQLTGWPLREAVGQPLDEVFHIINQHTRQPVENPAALVLKTGKAHGLANDTVLVSRQGAECVIADSAAAIVDDATGQPVGVVLVFRDQTREYAMQAELKFMNTLLATQQEVSVDGILVVDANGKILSFNRRFVDMWHIPPEVVESKSDERALQSVRGLLVEPALFFDKVRYLYEHRRETSRDEIALSDGRTFDRYSAPMFGPEDTYYGRVWYFRDITARKQIEEKLRDQVGVIEAYSGLVSISDLDGTLLYMNPNGLKMIGAAGPEAIINKNLADFNEPAKVNRVLKELIPAAIKDGTWTGEHTIMRIDGRIIPVMLTVFTVRDAAGALKHLGAIMIDNTARRQAEEKIRNLNTTLEQRITERTAELEAFAYSISHDLRAPLRAIDSFARIMSESHSAHVGKDGQHCLTVIQDNCRQMDRLIQGLLTFSRLSRQPLNKQNVDMHDLVGSVLKDFSAERKERCVKIILGHLPSCEADPLLLHQVWSNLISNAFKFTRSQKGAHIEIGSRPEKNQCVYFVKDNGVGFDMQYAHKLFNVFARLHRAEDYEGTGVGLAIIQRIILRHGGRVWIESEVNKGTTVCFTLT